METSELFQWVVIACVATIVLGHSYAISNIRKRLCVHNWVQSSDQQWYCSKCWRLNDG